MIWRTEPEKKKKENKEKNIKTLLRDAVFAADSSQPGSIEAIKKIFLNAQTRLFRLKDVAKEVTAPPLAHVNAPLMEKPTTAAQIGPGIHATNDLHGSEHGSGITHGRVPMFPP